MKVSIKHKTRLILVALVVAWGFDFLFWGKAPGISSFIFVLLCLLGGALVTWWEGLRPARTSLILLIPVLFFAAITFIRGEPFTQTVSALLVMVCLSIMVMTWRGGKWSRYSLTDYVIGLFHVALSALTRPVMLFFFHSPATQDAAAPIEGTSIEGNEKFTGKDETPTPLSEEHPVQANKAPGQALSILRGLLLAIPVLAILAALLAAADPIFSNDLNGFLSLFRIQNLGMLIFRAIYILVGAYLLIGLYLHAIGPSSEEKLIGLEKPWLAPFLGWTEAGIVLGAVDLLFAFFVAIQARYFFGGQANITTSGYTFAEYARRGFNELVGVAVISLLLILALSSITRRETRTQRRVFTALEVGLVILVGVILISAYQRLHLYEDAYGFTRIRTYTHVFMIWLGALLVITVALDLVSSLRRFALAALIVSLGFGVSISLLNVDAFIARQNIARAQAGSSLDISYLGTLSEDVVPALVAGFTDTTLPAPLHDQLGALLSCKAENETLYPGDTSWQSYSVSQSYARSLIEQHLSDLSAYPVKILPDGSRDVTVNGAEQGCYENIPVD